MTQSKNKEIKFRAWDKQEKIMCEVGILSYRGGGCFLHGNSKTVAEVQGDRMVSIPDCDNDGHFVYFQDLELMQYTGLLDKNGTEIYEGDIVKNNDAMWSLYWSDGCYKMALDGLQKDNDHLFIEEAQHSEVVGNNYENKDLLK